MVGVIKDTIFDDTNHLPFFHSFILFEMSHAAVQIYI